MKPPKVLIIKTVKLTMQDVEMITRILSRSISHPEIVKEYFIDEVLKVIDKIKK
jgi:hypothetical protein